MKGARALASGMLVLAAICAVPAVSAAQDTGMPAETTTTATTPSVPAQPVDPGSSDAPPSSGGPAAGDLSPINEQAVRDSSRGSVGVPASGPPDAAGGGAKAHKAASASVNMGDFFFSPGTVTIAVGDTVTWRNSGQAPHNASGDGISTPNLNNGQSASHTFNSAGTFSYICTIHPQMKGTVRVLSSSGGGSGGSAGTSSSSGSSESSAVASPDAAGTSTTLPMTGMAVGALALVGLAMLASGLLVRRAGDPKRGWLSLF